MKEANAMGVAPRGSQYQPIPCLLDEADDKLSHFDGLVCLESDDLLPVSERKQSGHTRIMPLSLHPGPSLLCWTLTSRKLSRSVGSLLMISSWTWKENWGEEGEKTYQIRSQLMQTGAQWKRAWGWTAETPLTSWLCHSLPRSWVLDSSLSLNWLFC
jgi:hypothetical protein